MDQNASATARYPDADLAEFQAIIEKKLEKSQDELGYLQEQILEITENSGDDHGGDWMDDSSTNNDIEFLNNMAIRQRKYIQDLENALVRIKNKSYGICSVTGQLIDKRRLLAVPTATKSVEAKNAEAILKETQKVEKKTPPPIVREKVEKKEGPAQPKIITKVIRKPKAAPAKPVDIEDDDDLDFGFDKEYDYSGGAEEETTDDNFESAGGAEEQPDVFADDDGGGDDDYEL
ncbi:MAG: TraR/DksA family transcriptional regulator [Lewinellaceae bacterium]|nr:TraR/DksA family transcriptional regulator [Saprospiraceae bacterium]MCB9338684.1 TraR/DksA family transcriptional regulator [Lewinellaceae bacterium]